MPQKRRDMPGETAAAHVGADGREAVAQAEKVDTFKPRRLPEGLTRFVDADERLPRQSRWSPTGHQRPKPVTYLPNFGFWSPKNSRNADIGHKALKGEKTEGPA